VHTKQLGRSEKRNSRTTDLVITRAHSYSLSLSLSEKQRETTEERKLAEAPLRFKSVNPKRATPKSGEFNISKS